MMVGFDNKKIISQVFKTKSNYLIIVILASSLPYLGLLNNYFLSDDFSMIYIYGNASSTLELLKIHWANYRPITSLVTFLEYPIFGNNPTAYHFTNLFFHILSAILVYLLLLKISQNHFLSLLAGILFGVHWSHVEPVAWHCVFHEMMYVVFILTSILFYIRFINKGWIILYLLAIIFFIISFFTEEKGILLIPLITAYDFIFNYKKRERNLKKLVLRIFPFYVVGLLCVALRNWVVGGTGISNEAGGYHINLFNIKFVDNFIRAMAYLVIPWNILDSKFYNNIIVLIQKYTSSYLWAFLLLIGLSFITLLFRRKYSNPEKTILFGIVWTAVSVGFFSLFNIALRYLFVVTVGYSILILGILLRLFESEFSQKRLLKHGVVLIFIIYVGLQLVSNFKLQHVYEKASQLSKQIVTEFHEVTKDISEDHTVFFINPPATLSSETGRASVDVFRFGYQAALKLMYGRSPFIVRNGMDFGDLYKIKSSRDVLKFEKAMEEDPYWKPKIPDKSKRHYVTFLDGHVRYVNDIQRFDWSKTGWRYIYNNDESISLLTLH